MGSLSNCGHDENNAYSGGKAGDQSGTEWYLREWYSCPWSCVLRHPDTQVRTTMSRLAAAAARNDRIGYDQGQRTTYWNELQKVNYDPSKITADCEADCSSGVCSNVKAAGYLLNRKELQGLEITSTHYMRNALTKIGFQCLTDSKYTSSSANLVAGDILLNDSHHTAMWVDDNPGSPGSSSGGSGGQVIQSLGIGSYEYKDYTVKAGDTIYSIAEKYKCTPAMILFVNNLTSSTLKAGQKLKIPTTKNTLTNPEQGTEPITTKHTSGILVHHPIIEAKFYTEQGLLATVSTTGLTKDTDFDNDLISVNTVRDLSQDCPTFSLNLVWRNNWYYALSSNDLVVISMQRPPEVKKTVFIGLIDDIRKVTDFSSGQPQRAVQVTGRGLNKALVSFDVGLLENLSIDSGTGFFADLVNLASCDSYDAIDLVLKSYIGRAIKYSFGDGSSLKDHYNYTGNHHEGEMLTDYQSYTSYNGNLWNFLKELTNAPFNETYWEIQNEKATLIHRRTPFNKEDWIELPRETIKDLDIVSDSTGRSDLETYTIYAVNPILGTETMVNVYMPLWYPPFVAKYGITQLTATTAYQNWGASGSDSSSDDSSGGGTSGGSFSGDTTEFISKVAPMFQKSGTKHGFTIVSFAIAQSALESGWGKSEDAKNKNNILGIGPHKYYSSWEACVEGYYTDTVLGRSSAAKNATTLDAYYQAFVASGYLGGSGQQEYYNKVKSIINTHNLTQYDKKGSGSTVTNPDSSTAGPIASSAGGSGDTEAIRRFYEELFNFNIKNNIFTNGTLVVKGRNSYHVGERVITESENMEYYVESVSHNFNCYGTWNTQLSVTRGIQPQDRFTPPWGSAEEMSAATLNAIIQQTSGEEIDWTNLPPVSMDIGSGGGGTVSGGSVEAQVYNYAKTKMGLNNAAACAILANINCESGFKLTSIGDNGTSYGLCQWHNSRWTNLKNHCAKNRLSVDSVEGQMSFLQHELQNSYSSTWNTLKNTPNTAQGSYDAAYYWCVHFEVPANKESKGRERGNLARNTYFPKYK